MENNKDRKLDFDVDANKTNNGSDDELESLLFSSSSAEDALNAISYDKESRTLTGTDEQQEDSIKTDEVSESDESKSVSDDVKEQSADTENEEPETSSDSLDITLGVDDNKTLSSAEPEKIHNDEFSKESDENSADNDESVDELSEITEDIAAEPDKSYEDSGDEAFKQNEEELSESPEANLDTALPATSAVNARSSRTARPSKSPKRKPSAASAKKKSVKEKGRSANKKSKVNSSIFTGIIITIIILTISTVIAFTGITVGLEFLGVGKSTNTIKLNIDETFSVDDITDALYDKGIIDNKFLFKLCIDIKDAADKIVPGDIELQPSMSYNDKINKLMQSRQNFETVDITFPEGTTLYEAAKMLKQKEVISSITNFIYDFNSLKVGGYDYEDVIDAKGDKFFAMEGYFYPDTYQFYKDSDNETVIRTIRDVFNTRVNSEMRQRAEDLGYSLDEVITIASIVQLESANVEEMPTIASILKNRLEDGPYNRFGEYIARLQSDPTANYYTDTIAPAVEEINNYTATEAAEFKSKYDTYEREGLPVGPICNPGLDAINAVLYPAETDYFYFCHDISTKKGYYASTLSEHEANLVAAGITQ